MGKGTPYHSTSPDHSGWPRHSGWQPRWFILEGGVLSYYQSREDVSKGSKGSIKVSVSDISVHATDATRLDLTIPSEQHYYLRAGSPAERQQWLIALGRAKQAAGPARAARDKPGTASGMWGRGHGGPGTEGRSRDRSL